MSEFSDAFAELREEFDFVTDKRNTVKIGSKSYPAIVEDVTFEEIETSGGKGEAGGFRAIVALAVMSKRPEQLAEISARGQSVFILSVENNNDVTWTIVAGDPAIE